MVAENVGFSAIGYQGFFSAGDSGALAYLQPDPGWNLVWFGRQGRRLGTVLEPGQYHSLCNTPDGSRIFFDRVDEVSGNVEVWLLDLVKGVKTRLTFDPSTDIYPICSPTGEEVVFASNRRQPISLFRQTVSAPGSETPLLQAPTPTVPTDWSRDGRWLVYSAYDSKTNWDVWVMPLSGGEPFAFAATPAEERNGRLSPDGHWLAYTYQQGGTSDVYVQPFPRASAKWQVSTDGGRNPVWRADGRELFYLSPDQKIMAVEVRPSPSGFAFGPSRVVVETHIAGLERVNHGSPFAVTPDGERFLVSSTRDAVRPVTLVLNWTGKAEGK